MKMNMKKTPRGLVLVVAMIALLSLLLASCSAHKDADPIPSEDTYSFENPVRIQAEPDEGFVIDGILDEEEYQNCNWLKLQNTQGGAGVDIAMTSYYGKNGMYIVYDVTESSRIYVNPDRPSYLNSCIEMYLASSNATSMSSNEVFEIDMLPTGDLSIRQRTGKDNWVNVASTDDVMARLGATTKGGPVNTEECTGYNLELFIPWDYLDYVGLDASDMKKDFFYINPVHITSYNYEGIESGTDRYWYSFVTQVGSDGWNDVAQYFRFGGKGVIGTVPIVLVSGDNYTISGNDSVIPGMMTTIELKPDTGYAFSSIKVNGEEYIHKVSYNEDGSVTLQLRGEKEGLKISAVTQKVTEGNKTLSGTVQVHKLGGDTLEGVSISYKGPGGEKPIELDEEGKFTLTDLKQGYYTVMVTKNGYAPVNRGIYLNCDIETELTLEYQMFRAESGYNWILDDQNDGVLQRFGGSGKILSVDSFDKFSVKASFKYDTELAEQSNGDTFYQQRAGIQLKFGNGKYWRVDLMNENGVFKVQYAKHNDSTLFSWKTVHELTKEEIAQYQSEDGIEMSILRDDNYVWVCLNDRPVAIEVLDAEYAELPAQIGFEGWIANPEIEEMEYDLFQDFDRNLRNFYFTTNTQWDISRQLEGVLTLPKGGSAAIPFYGKYTDVDITLTDVKEHDTTGKKPGRTDILLEFDTNGNGTADKSVSFGIVCTDPATKTCWVQTLGNADNYIAATRIKGLYKLSNWEAEKYLNGSGLDLRVVRKGTEVYVFVEGEEVAIWDLTQNYSGVTAKSPATVSVRHYDAKGTVELGFEITGNVGHIQINKIFKDNDNWNLTKQNQGTVTVDGVTKTKGVVSLPGGGTDTSLQFFKRYQNIDLTVTAKENDTTGKKPGRTDILFEFDINNDGTMDKNVSFGIVQLSGGRCVIQTLGWPDKHIPAKRMNELYELDYAETLKYKSEGVDLRVVRYGTNAYVYLDGKQVEVFDLTQNYSGVKANTKATMFLRHYDAVANEIVIPFTVTDQVTEPEVVPLPKPVFKPNHKWDLSQQNLGTVTVNGVEALKGIASLPGGGTNAVVFYDQFADIDLTITAKENAADGEARGRTDVLLEFENGKNISFGVLCVDEETGDCWIQALNSANDTANAGKYIINRGKGFYKLTAEEAAKYNGEGVDLRIVRNGTTVLMFLDGKQVAVCDLTQNDSGVTADMKATVSLRHYDAVADRVDIPFTVTDTLSKVEIINESADGAVTTQVQDYVIGATVVVVAKENDHYVSALTVDGVDVAVNNDGTYSFTATKSSYTINGTSAQRVFKNNSKWDLTKQNQGTITVDGVEKVKGTVTLPGAGTDTSLQLYKKYQNVDITVTAKENDTAGNKFGRTDILFEFDLDNDGAMDKNVSFGIVQQSGGRCVIQTLGWPDKHIPVNRTNDLYELDYAETLKYKNEGVDLRVVRYGTYAYIYLDGKQVAVFDLGQNNSGVKADSEAAMFLRHYDAVATEIVIPFTLTDQVARPAVVPLPKSVFKPNHKWDLSQQNQGAVTANGVEALKGVVSLPGGGTNAVVFSDQFTDIDLTIKAKENKAATAANGGRTDILFEFENGKNVSFGIVKWSSTSSCIVETLGNSTNHIPASRKNTLYTLNATETDAYLTDGVELRVVRSGTDVYVFCEGKAVAVFDLTQNNSGVTADMKATVSLRHYDAVADKVDIPFTVADEITKVTIHDTSVNGKVVAARDTYVVGSEIVLMAEAEGYNLMSLKVDGTTVTVGTDGVYRFIATKSSYTVEGTFREAVFVSGFDTSLWDVSGQYDGYVTVKGGGGSTNQPLQFTGTYQNMDLTVNARDYADSSTASRTDIEFVFENGQTVTFGISEGNKVQTRGGTILSWKAPHDLTQAEKDQLVITAEEIAAGNEDGLDLRLIRYGTTMYIFVENRQVAVIDLTKCANTNGDTASGVTATTKMSVYLRHYDDKRTDGVDIPFSISTDVKPIELTTQGEYGTVSTVSKVNSYVNNVRTATTSDVHFLGEKLDLTVKPSKGYKTTDVTMDGTSVLSQMVDNGDGAMKYSFVAAKTKHAAVATFEQIIIFENNYDSNLWDLSGQYDGYVTVIGGGGSTNQPLQFAGTYQNVDLTLNARDYADSTTASRTEFGFEFDVDGDGVIDTAKGDQTVTFGIAEGNRVQTRGGTLLSWKTPYDLTAEEKDQLVITAEEIAAGNEDGLDLRLIRYGTTIYIFVEGKQVAICDLTKCANSAGDTASGITADTKMFIYLRHYDDKRTDGVDIPFSISTDVAPVDITITANETGTVAVNSVNYYVNNGRTSKPSETHFKGEKITLTMTPSATEYIVNELLVNEKDVTGDITEKTDGTYEYILNVSENAYTVKAKFNVPIFKDDYDTALWDLAGQYDSYAAYSGVVALPNGGGATNKPLEFIKVYGNVELALLVRDYPDGDKTEDARTDVEFIFDNGETVTFGVVKTGGLYRIQTRGGTLLSWKTPYYITNQTLIDAYVVTAEELSSGNPGGLDFRVVRYGTEFYLYLNGTMVKGYDFSYKIAADTPVTIKLRHYDDAGQRVEIPFKVTENVTPSDLRLFSNKTAVTDYAYSFAVLPDTQIVAENDVKNGETNLAKLFDWIVTNKSSKNIQYVFGLGDITQNNNAAEWTLAQAQFAKLSAAGIPYSAIRGNHDLSWYGKEQGSADYYTDDYTAYIGTSAYRAQFEGFYSDTNVSNSWRTFTVGEVKYLMLTLDYGADDNVLNWASNIIAQHPYHNVIITTHAYLYRDGTTLDSGDNTPPSTTGGTNDGDDMWDKLVSKHENIILVMCGHDPSESIVVNRSNGVNGNVVTSMLIDAQDVEAQEGSMGMVAMLYFSEDGKNLQVEYYSTAKEKYFMSSNQFSTELDVVEEPTVYGTGYVPVSGQQVKTTSSFTSFPRTIEVTFNRSSNTTRAILLGNCGGSSNDYFNLECPVNENIIYLNLCLGGTTYQHSFNTVSIPTGQTVRVTVVLEDTAVKCYVNGVLAQTRTVTNGSNGSKTMAALLASAQNANLSNLWGIGNDLRNYPFIGTIYDIALWSDARTAEEIAGSSIEKIATASYQDNLLAAYNFWTDYKISEQNFGKDLSGNSNDLTGTLNVGTGNTKLNIDVEATVYGTGYVPVSGQQVTTTSSFTSFPRTIEVTFNRSSNTTRAILLGNCGGSSNDYFNLECPKNENIIYLNLCLGGTTYQHSFNTVSIPTGQTVRVTVVLEDAAVKCYVNGVLAQTRTVTNGGNGSKTMAALWESVPKANLSNLWGIGNDLRNYPFIGTIYDIALWSDARTAEEIAGSSIANLGTAEYNDNLLAAYNFLASYKVSEQSFDKDLSGNGNDLTGTLNVGISTTAPVMALAAIAIDDLMDDVLDDDAAQTPTNGETTPPAGDSGDGETTPPVGDSGDGETTPPTGDSGDGETTPPTGDSGDGETTPPAGDTSGGETTPPAGDSGDGETTPHASDSGDGEATPTAGDPGDGGNELEPAA